MARLFLSFLGVSNYTACDYALEEERVKNVRFIQEALVKILCKNWIERDKIIVFLTETARERNWYDNGQKDINGNTIETEGLKTRLEKLNLPAQIVPVSVPEGKSEEEVWEIFETVFNSIGEKDEVTFDITHAFRSLPLLAVVILNYAKILKQIEIKGIYYGAFEARVNDVAPVFDLTSFVDLLDWTNAVDNFLSFGDAKDINTLISKKLRPLLENKNENAIKVKNLGKLLEDFTENLQTSRGPNILSNFNYSRLKELIKESKKNSLMKPLDPLFDRLMDKFKNFTNNDIENGYNAVKWCIEHNLIQQGYTIFQETIISELVLKYFGESEIMDEDSRTLISQAINLKKSSTPEEDWLPPASENREIIKKIINDLDEELIKIYDSLSQYRNDINHAGFKHNSARPDRLKKKLADSFERYIKMRETIF